MRQMSRPRKGDEMNEHAGPGARVPELRKALEDADLRAHLAAEERLLENAVEEVLKWLNLGSDGKPLKPGDEDFADPGSCGGWAVAEELALIMAIGAHSEAGFKKWAKEADSFKFQLELCEVLSHAP